MKVTPLPKDRQVLIKLSKQDDRLLDQAAASALHLKNILVPIDFSDCSKKALTYALPFAQQFGSAITLIHVVAPYYVADPYGLTQYERIEDELRAAGKKKLKELIARDIPPSIKVNSLTVNGRPGTEIVEAARQLHADIIVIATHGYTGLKHVVFGSTAEYVVRNAPCPVLSVRQKEHESVPII